VVTCPALHFYAHFGEKNSQNPHTASASSYKNNSKLKP
jgi:hypothetical protein